MNNRGFWSTCLKTLMALILSLSTFTVFAEQQGIGGLQNAIIGNKKIIKKGPKLVIPPPPNIDARGYVLMDANTGRVLAEKNMHERMPPASLTKLMTMYILSETIRNGQVKLDDKVRVSESAWRRGGSRMFLKLGSQVPVNELIKGIIVASGNDACVAVAEYLAGNEASFAELMNTTAKRIGMKNSHFTDSTGLPDPNHYSTPYDIALLARHVIYDYPEDYQWYKEKWIKYNRIKQPNRNRLLWRDPYVDGLKTGHTKAAGYCLAASAVRPNGMRLITVVMGTPSDKIRNSATQALLNWGFRFFKSYKVADGERPLKMQRIYLGQKKYIPMGLRHTFYVSVPLGEGSALHAKLKMRKRIKAPIKVGQPYGSIEVTLNGKLYASAPVVALQSDELGGFWRRMLDRILMLFTGWFS